MEGGDCVARACIDALIQGVEDGRARRATQNPAAGVSGESLG